MVESLHVSERGKPLAKPDHRHKCCKCGRSFWCRWFTLKKCHATGVFNAIKVNGDGPFCDDCREEIEEANLALLRKWKRQAKKK